MTWNKDKDVFALMVGHGKSLDGSWDSGCVYKEYTEAGLMLKIVKRAVKWLRKSGVKVITDSGATYVVHPQTLAVIPNVTDEVS